MHTIQRFAIAVATLFARLSAPVAGSASLPTTYRFAPNAQIDAVFANDTVTVTFVRAADGRIPGFSLSTRGAWNNEFAQLQ